MKLMKKKAQSLIEYALILGMVAVVAIAALQLLGNNIGTTLRNAADTVGKGSENAGSNACQAMGPGFQWDDKNKTCVYSNGTSGGSTPSGGGSGSGG